MRQQCQPYGQNYWWKTYYSCEADSQATQPIREIVQCPSTNRANSRHAMPQPCLRRCSTVKHTVDSYTKLLTTVTVGPTLKRQDFQTRVNSSLNPPRARLAWKFASLLVLSAALTSRTNHTQPITTVPRLQPRESQTRPSRSTKSSKHTINKQNRVCLLAHIRGFCCTTAKDRTRAYISLARTVARTYPASMLTRAPEYRLPCVVRRKYKKRMHIATRIKYLSKLPGEGLLRFAGIHWVALGSLPR